MKELSNLLLAMISKNEKTEGSFFERNKTKIIELKASIKNLLDGNTNAAIRSLHNQYVDKFVQAQSNLDIDMNTARQIFMKSQDFIKFSDEANSILVNAVLNEDITEADMKKYIEDFDIVSEDDPPMPTEAPPPNKKWVMERDKAGKAKWILLDK